MPESAGIFHAEIVHEVDTDLIERRFGRAIAVIVAGTVVRDRADAVICSKNAPDSWLIGLATAANQSNQPPLFPFERVQADVPS